MSETGKMRNPWNLFNLLFPWHRNTAESNLVLYNKRPTEAVNSEATPRNLAQNSNQYQLEKHGCYDIL
jgi:hypothetical protein